MLQFQIRRESASNLWMAAIRAPAVFYMSVSSARAARVLVPIVLLLLLVISASAAQQHPVRKRPVKQEQPALPPPPPPPPTLEQMPARPPTVTFSSGLLTIVAENSTLGDILRAVRTQTKATVEIPQNTSERVVTHLGPGTVRDVLTSLLNGSHYNYVMLESATRAGMVDRLILTSNSGGPVEAGSAPIPARPNGAPEADMEQSDAPAVDISEQPNDSPAENPSSEEAQPAEPGAQSPVKTPEQLLRELQLQQQQQQHEHGGQDVPNRPPQ